MEWGSREGANTEWIQRPHDSEEKDEEEEEELQRNEEREEAQKRGKKSSPKAALLPVLSLRVRTRRRGTRVAREQAEAPATRARGTRRRTTRRGTCWKPGQEEEGEEESQFAEFLSDSVPAALQRMMDDESQSP